MGLGRGPTKSHREPAGMPSLWDTLYLAQGDECGSRMQLRGEVFILLRLRRVMDACGRLLSKRDA